MRIAAPRPNGTACLRASDAQIRAFVTFWHTQRRRRNDRAAVTQKRTLQRHLVPKASGTFGTLPETKRGPHAIACGPRSHEYVGRLLGVGEGLLGDLGQGGERSLVLVGDLREDLAVKLNAGKLQAVHEL